MKQNFFKTNAFKCILVLMCIMLFSGGLLSILNDVLAVSSEERLSRAIVKVYGKKVDVKLIAATDENGETLKDADGNDIPLTFECNYGTVNTIYFFEDEGESFLLYNATGNKGYKDGTITLWLLIALDQGDYSQKSIEEINGNAAGIQKVVLDGYQKQTLMSKLGGRFYSAYSELDIEDIRSGKLISVDSKADPMQYFVNVETGATKSCNAANNAVNTVLLFVWGEQA